MAGGMIKEVKLRAKFDVDSLKECENEINKFLKKYENKKAADIELIDFRSTISNLSNLKKTIDKLSSESPELKFNKNFTDLQSQLNIFLQNFQSTIAVFENGIKNNLNDILNIDFAKSPIMAGGFGERLEYLQTQSKNLVDILKELSGLDAGGYWRGPDVDQNNLSAVIDTMNELVEVQKSLESFYGKKLSSADFASRYSTSGLSNIIENWEKDLDEMQKYNIETTKLLRERRQLIADAQEDLWDESDQSTSKSHINDTELYNEDIETLTKYIKRKKELLSSLKENEYDLFDGDSEFYDYIEKTKNAIENYESYLQELQNLRNNIGKETPGTNIDLSSIVQQLEEIKQSIDAIREAFEPLTTALSTEDSALHNMLTASISDLDILSTKLNEVYQMINNISTKQFNVNNIISNGNSNQADLEQIRAFRKEAKSVFDEVQELYDEATITISKIQKIPGGMDEVLNFSNLMSDFDPSDLAKRIKARSSVSLGVVIDELNEWKKVLLQFNTLRNNVEKGSFNVNKYTDTSSKVSIGSKTTDKDEKKIVDDTTVDNDDILKKIKSLSEQVEIELTSIRSKMEETFNFDTIDLKSENIKNSIDNIYQQFVELQTKINALEFNIKPLTADQNIQVDTRINNASEAIENEGKSASDAVSKKNAFTEANKQVAESARETEEATKGASEGIEIEAKAARDNANAWDKTKSVQSDYGQFPSSYSQEKTIKNDKSYQTIRESYSAVRDADGKLTGELELNTVTFVNNFKKRADASVKESTKIKNAQADLQKFISQFDSKTAGMGKYLKGYNTLANFKISNLDDIDKAAKLMMDLDTEYNKVTLDFRKGTSSMNPFVNAINGVQKMEAQINDAYTAFNGLNEQPDELNNKLSKLRPLLESIKLDLSDTDVNGNAKQVDIYGAAQKYGQLKIAINDVTSSISSQRREESLAESQDKSRQKQLKELYKLYQQQAESAAKITEYRSKLQSGDIGDAETNRLLEKIALEKNHIATLQGEIDTYGDLYNKETQINVIQQKRVQTLNEIADAKAKASDQQETKDEKEAQLSYEKVLNIQEKIYAIKKKMVGTDPESSKGQELSRELSDKQKEYNELTKSITDRKQQIALKKQEIQLDKELQSLQQEQVQKSQINTYEKILQLQEKLYDLKKKMVGVDLESSKGQEMARKLAEAQKEYNDAMSSANNITVGQLQSIKSIKSKQEAELNKLRSEYSEKNFAKQEEKDLEYVLSLYKKYIDAATSIKKMQSDTTGTVYTDRMASAIEAVQKAKKELLDIGIDVNNISESELLTEKQKNALLDEQVKYKQKIQNIENTSSDKVATKENKANLNYGKTIYNRESRYSESIDAKARSYSETEGLSKDLENKIEQYKSVVTKLQQLRTQFAEDPNASKNSKLTKDFQDAALEAENLRKEILSVFKESEKLDKSGVKLGSIKLDPSELDDYKVKMMELAAEVTDGKFKFESFNATGTEMYGTVTKGSGAVEKITVAFDKATGKLVALNSGAKQVTNSYKQLGNRLKDTAKHFATLYLSAYKIIQVFRTGINYVKEIDLAMTELRKVTDETDETYNNFLKTAAKTSSVIGSTISEFTQATSDFARLGYSIEEASKMAESALVYTNVGDEVDSVDEATQSIISTMKAFGIEATDTMSIIDRFNEVGNRFAITSGGIGEALQRSASALYEAGNTLDESIALVTGANSVIQNPEQVGTALKTLALRLRGTKTELEEAGEDTDGMAESVSQLQEKLLALTHGKVNIMLDADTFKSTTQILREMSAAWEDMTDIERASALELMGGKRQANILSSLIKNFDTVEKVIETSSDSTGSAMKENEKWLNSIEGKMNTFTNTLQTFWSNFIDSSVVKDFIDFGTNVVKFLDTTHGKIIALTAAFAGFAKFKGFSLKGIGIDAINSIGKQYASATTLKGLQVSIPVNSNLSGQQLASYAAAVSDLTAKQQAAALATAGLNKEQIKFALSCNNLSEDVIREATAHVVAAKAKNDESITEQELIANKVQLAIASLQQKNSTDAQTVADFLKANSSKMVNEETTKQIILESTLTTEQKAQALAALGLSAKNITLATSFKAVGTAIQFAFMSNPIGATITAITTVISLVSILLSALSSVIRSNEEIEQSAREAVSAYQSAQTELENQKKTTDELASSYERLAPGVNTETNTNIGLTTEAYEEYLDVCNQIADMYPELVAGYDAQGNAILTLKGKVEGLTEAYKKANEEAANALLSDKNKKDIWKTYKNKATEASGVQADSTKSAQKDVLEAFKSMSYEDLNNFYEYFNAGLYSQWAILKEQMQKNGTYVDDDSMYNALWSLALEKESFEDFKASVNSHLSEVNQDISAGMSGIRETLSASLIFDSVYQGLDESSKGIVKSIINNLDPKMIADSGAKSADDFIKYFSSNIIAKVEDNKDLFSGLNTVSDAMTEAMAGGNSDAFNKAKNQFNGYIKDWIDPDTGNVVIDEDADAVTQYLQRMAQSIQNQSKNYEVRLQMQTDFDSDVDISDIVAKTRDEYKSEIEEALKGLGVGENASIKDIYSHIATTLAGDDGKLFSDELVDLYNNQGDLTGEQLQAMQALDAIMKAYGTDIDTVKSKLIELGLILPSLEDIKIFDLSSEDTQDQINKFQSDIDSIKEAWNSLNDREMTESEFVELAMEFPDLMDGVNLADDNWMVKAKENVEELNRQTFDDFIEKLNQAKAAMEAQGLDTSVLDSYINYVYELQNMPLLDQQANTVPDTISELESAYENYKTILEETNEVLYDGQKVSSDYYDSLKEYIDDVEELDSCFDKNNKSIVKNVTKLKSLINQQKKETANTVKIAKAQAQLKYKQLLEQLIKTTSSSRILTLSQIDQVNTLQAQIASVREAIDEYKLLELSLAGATQAFEEYQKAKDKESETDYEPTMLEMINSVMEGYDTGKVGKDSFIAAVKGLFSEEVAGMVDSAETLDQVWEAMTEGNMNKFFTYADNEFSITRWNMENFVSTCQEAGLMSGDSFEEFGIVAGKSLEDFEDELGLSKDAIMAFLDILSDYTIGGRKIWGDLADFEGAEEFDQATAKLDELIQKRIELQKTGDYNGQYEGQIAAAQENLNKQYDAAISKVDKYTAAVNMLNATNQNSGLTYTEDQLKKIQNDFNELFGTNYSFKIENGKLVATEQDLTEIQAKKDGLSKPLEWEVNLKYSDTLSKIEELKKEKEELGKLTTAEFEIKYGAGVDKNKILSSLNSQIEEAEAEADELEIQYGLTPRNSEDTSIIEKFETWESDGIDTTVNLDTTQATADGEKLEQDLSEPVTKTVTVNVEQGTATVEGGESTTVDFKLGNGYKTVLQAIADLTTKCSIPIPQEVEVDDNDTTQEIKDAVVDLDEYEIEDKDFYINMDGYSEVVNELNTILDKLEDIDEMTSTATISIQTVKTEKTVKEVEEVEVSRTTTQQRKYGNVIGTAIASGSPGLPNAEKGALVGELGPEAVVDPISGKYYTVGDNGAEFVNLPKGAIIFNHKQTEELLSKGYTTSRGKQVNGNAFASGNAHATTYPYQTYMDHYNVTGTQPTQYDNSSISEGLSDAASDLSDAADDLSDAADDFEETFDWIEIRFEELDETLSLLEAKLENAVGASAKNNILDQILNLNDVKMSNYQAALQTYTNKASEALAAVPAEFRDAAQNGAIAITEFVGEADEAVVDAINTYREWAQKIADVNLQIEQLMTDTAERAKEKFDNIVNDYENTISLIEGKIDQLEAYNELTEAKYGSESANIYRAIIAENQNNISKLEAQRRAMQEELNNSVRSGLIEYGSDDWYDAVNAISDVDTQIIELTTDIEKLKDEINEIYWDHFENIMSQIEMVTDEADNLIDILTDKDVVDEAGNWTDEGIAALGLYAQKMDAAKVQAEKYKEQIDYLNNNWEKLGYTQQEYLEKLDELKSAQYDAIKAYNDTKDAIADLTSERVDAIKKGIEKEIDAYEKLIQKKKEALDADKDLHDFQKNVMDQQQEIAAIQRKLEALAADNSASARAQKAQLEAELVEKMAELNETYYDRSISDQQDALDQELDDFTNTKNEEIEGWDEYLTNVETVVADALSVVQANTDTVYQTLKAMGQEYSLDITDSLTSPWKDGANAVQSFSEKFGVAMSSTADALRKLADDYKQIMAEIENYGNTVVNKVNTNASTYTAVKQPTTSSSSNTTTKTTTATPEPAQKQITVGGKINAGSATIYADSNGGGGGRQYFASDPIYVVVSEKNGYLLVRHHSLSSGYTGWFKKSDVKAYKKGTTGVSKSGFAITDEDDLEELVLHAGPDGRLQYLTKGSSVLTNDITERLMNLAMNPQDMLDRNRPVITPSKSIVNNEINIDCSVGELVHIEHCDQNTLPDVEKIVDKAFNKHMQNLNNSIKRYTR